MENEERELDNWFIRLGLQPALPATKDNTPFIISNRAVEEVWIASYYCGIDTDFKF